VPVAGHEPVGDFGQSRESPVPVEGSGQPAEGGEGAGHLSSSPAAAEHSPLGEDAHAGQPLLGIQRMQQGLSPPVGQGENEEALEGT
jgi:hypothetical protein